MNKLGAGIMLMMSACIMQSTKVIAAAVYMSVAASQSRELFNNGMEYVGRRLDVMAALAACAGAAFIIWYLTGRNKSN